MVQRPPQVGLVHLGAAGDLPALRLRVELGSRLSPAVRTRSAPRQRFSFLARLFGAALALATLGAAEVARVLFLALVLGGARLAQPDGDRLLGILHLAAAARLQLAVLEFVHHSAHRPLLRSRLFGHYRSSWCGGSEALFGSNGRPAHVFRRMLNVRAKVPSACEFQRDFDAPHRRTIKVEFAMRWSGAGEELRADPAISLGSRKTDQREMPERR